MPMRTSALETVALQGRFDSEITGYGERFPNKRVNGAAGAPDSGTHQSLGDDGLCGYSRKLRVEQARADAG